MITDAHEGDLTVGDDLTVTGMMIGIVRVTEHGDCFALAPHRHLMMRVSQGKAILHNRRTD